MYEVLRDGVLVSTGGLEVRPPHAPTPTIAHSLRLSALPPSGAKQLDAHENPPDPYGSLVRFVYEEMPWTVRKIGVIDERNSRLVTRLDKSGEGFSKTIRLPYGDFKYRFCVVVHDALQMHLANPTRLGWDDGAMVRAAHLMTWPLTVHVADLLQPGAVPGDGLVRAPEIDFSEKHSRSSSLTTTPDDDEEDDDDIDDADDESHISMHSVDHFSNHESLSVTVPVDETNAWLSDPPFDTNPVTVASHDDRLPHQEDVALAPVVTTDTTHMRTPSHDKLPIPGYASDTATNEEKRGDIDHHRHSNEHASNNGRFFFMGSTVFALSCAVSFLFKRRAHRFSPRSVSSDGASESDDGNA